ncbi:MAG: glutamine amidotransferase [Actinomycetaceae bacterium]|nr:glutamine amidotransferase [Actinomycetaceae bacterium]
MGNTAKFLLIGSRQQEDIAQSEYEKFLQYTGLGPDQLIRLRLDKEPMPDLVLDDWAGIILCGSPFDSLIPEDEKSDLQKRVEAEIFRLLDDVIVADHPFMGVCYGVGTVLAHQGGLISNKYAEEISAPLLTLTEDGRADPITRGMPPTFHAYVGHKEACEVLPPHATLLATAPSCPVQLFKVGDNVYGTQFHPELDWPALYMRIIAYAQAGYYAVDEQQRIIDNCEATDVSQVHQLLRNFVEIYGKS